jgi:hypothetical protein
VSSAVARTWWTVGESGEDPAVHGTGEVVVHVEDHVGLPRLGDRQGGLDHPPAFARPSRPAFAPGHGRHVGAAGPFEPAGDDSCAGWGYRQGYEVAIS